MIHRPIRLLPFATPNRTDPPPTLRFPIASQHLRKLTPLPDRRPLPVKHIDGDGDQDGQKGQDGRRPLQSVPVADMFVHGAGVHGSNAGQEVAGEAVAAGGGGGVGAVGGDHVVDRCHVDGVVCDPDQGCEDEGGDPVGDVRGAQACPSEAEEADGETRGEVEEPVESAFGLEGVGLSAPDLAVAVDKREEGDVGDDVAEEDGAECQSRGDDGKVPLSEDGGEGFEEGEDQGVGEAREKGETEDDGFADEHFEGADPDCKDFAGGNALGFEFVGAVDVGILAGRTAVFGFAVDEDGAASFGDEEEVENLGGAAED